MQNAEAILNSNIRYIPKAKGFENTSEPEPAVEPKVNLLGRYLTRIGIFMAPSNITKPPGLVLNLSTLATLIAILGAIFGAYAWTAKTNEENGYQRGVYETERRQMAEQREKDRLAQEKVAKEMNMQIEILKQKLEQAK